MIKRFSGRVAYEWHKINVFVSWVTGSGKTIVLVFDAPADLRHRIPSPIFDGLDETGHKAPFWVYTRLAEEVVRLQDETVWEFCRRVRTIEKGRSATGLTPNPDFGSLYDLGRHVIHIMETLEVAITTMGAIVREHDKFRERLVSAGRPSTTTDVLANDAVAGERAVHEKLCSFQYMLENLRARAASNRDRLHDEIQLAFHLVTKHNAELSLQMNRSIQVNAELSLQMSRTMRADSQVMKTVAMMTLVFLPATFVSALFSTSFFTYDITSGWHMSSYFWVYWVTAIPLTLLTVGLWHVWFGAK